MSLAILRYFTLALFLTFPFVCDAEEKPAFPDPEAEELATWCKHLSKELRSVNLERCLKRHWKIAGNSLGERPIPYYRWGKACDDDKAQRVLIIGGIHGDEITSVSMVFRWIDFLERTKADSFLRENVYLLFPLTNPDGFYAKPRTRTNLAGVDLNRNFVTRGWEEKALDYWKTKANSDPRRYPGATPASELETKILEKAVNDFKPDIIISVHAPYYLLDHDGPVNFPKLKSPLPVRALGAFPGSLGTYAGLERNIPVITPELPSADKMPDEQATQQLLVFIMKSRFGTIPLTED